MNSKPDNIDEVMQYLLDEKIMRCQEMASGLAHELNNPLAIIIGKLDLIEMKLKKSNALVDLKLEPQFESVRKMTFRIKKIVESLRYIAEHPSDTETDIIQLKSFLEPVLELSNGHFIHNEIKFEIKGEIPAVEIIGRQNELSQILMTIIMNSVQALEDKPEKWIHLEFEQKDDFLHILIIDSGHGIAPDVERKLFTPFFTTKGPEKGTGIGLCLAKKSIQNQGGDIFYKKSNINTCFVVKIKKNINN